MTWEHEAFPGSAGPFYGGDMDFKSVEGAVYGADRDVGSVEGILPVQQIFHGATSLGRGCFLPPSAV